MLSGIKNKLQPNKTVFYCVNKMYTQTQTFEFGPVFGRRITIWRTVSNSSLLQTLF